MDLLPIDPVTPPAAYLGGKRVLAKRLVSHIAMIPHRTYVEPCVGMGGVFLRRTRKPSCEVINDISGDVANMFRIVQRHYDALMTELTGQLTSRAEFARQVRTDPSTLTDIERAARFLYLQRLCFGGRIKGRTFGVSKGTPARFDVEKLRPLLQRLQRRLSGVVIEQLPYGDVIRRYDSADTLFYIDPPYVGCETDYGDQYGPDDLARLAEQLSGISGRFVLSINDTPLSRDLFAAFDIEAVEVAYTVSRSAAQRVGELIISNCRDIR